MIRNLRQHFSRTEVPPCTVREHGVSWDYGVRVWPRCLHTGNENWQQGFPYILCQSSRLEQAVMDLEDGFKMKMDMDMYGMTNMTTLSSLQAELLFLAGRPVGMYTRREPFVSPDATWTQERHHVRLDEVLLDTRPQQVRTCCVKRPQQVRT